MNNSELIKENYTIQDLEDIVARLRSPQGCPWDREQTHESLKSCLIEECYEVIEAINQKDDENLTEELGDVLLQVYLHSEIAKEEERFTLEQVVQNICEKLIRRHPHVFGTAEALSAKEGLNSWEGIKALEKKGKKEENTPLKSVPASFPALIRAQKVLKKAGKVYGEKQCFQECITKMESLLETVENKLKVGEETDIQPLIGEMLFQIVYLSCICEENAENSLTNQVETFINIFEGNKC